MKAANLILFFIIALLFSCVDRRDCTLLADNIDSNVVWKTDTIGGEYHYITFSNYKKGVYESNDTTLVFMCLGVESDSLFLYEPTCWDKIGRYYIDQYVGIDCDNVYLTNWVFEVVR